MWNNLCNDFIYYGKWKKTLFVFSLFIVITIILSNSLSLDMPKIFIEYKNLALISFSSILLMLVVYAILLFIIAIIKINNTATEDKEREDIKIEIRIYLKTIDKKYYDILKEIITREYIVNDNIFPLLIHKHNYYVDKEYYILQKINNKYSLNNVYYDYFSFPHGDKCVNINPLFLLVLKEKV